MRRPQVKRVRVIALILGCHACGEQARVECLNDQWQRWREPGGAFFLAHWMPEIMSAEVEIDGQLSEYRVSR